jgi:large subunit ribosomal protein L15
MLQLNNLASLSKKRKRVGRGGKSGGYSGRGSKGQKSRSGANSEIKAFFEGGQMPLARRLPRRGFVNPFKKEFKLINLTQLEGFFKAGEIVNKETLVEKNLIKGKAPFLVKVLGDGELTKALTIQVDSISESAAKAVEKVGGKIELIKAN